MTSVTFYGHVPMTYPDYIDLATGRTLTCQPGQTYNVAPASGNVRSAGTTMPNDGRFTATAGREVIAGDEESSPEDARRGVPEDTTIEPTFEEN
jgi:hypothetical protein